MKRSISVICLLAAWLPTMNAQTWNENFLNQPLNLRYESLNPTRLTDNAVHDYAVANVQYGFGKGEFHAIDHSGNTRELSAYVGGLRHIGKFDVAGYISYSNLTEKEQAWSNTLWTNAYNPFAVCDSVPGDATTEAFRLHATAAYTLNNHWRLGAEIGVETGNRADQTDPRPETTTSVVPVTIGLDYQPFTWLSFGLSGGYKHLSSILEYYNVQTLNNHTYFIMKGMGDYMRRSTGTDSGYKREFKGKTYNVAFNAKWQHPNGRLADFLEVAYATQNQDARDGGTAYEFFGGDYEENNLSFRNRFQWRSSARVLHNFTASLITAEDKGVWYEQKRNVDTDHGNLVYYSVLAKNVIHKSSRLTAALIYQLDFLRDGQRDLYFKLAGGYSSLTQKHYLGSTTPKQEISLIDVDLQVGKIFSIGNVKLLTQLHGGFTAPQTKKYATGSPYTDSKDITDTYTAPMFEYASARQWRGGLLVDASTPVSEKLTVGLHASVDCRFYADDEKEWKGYKNHSFTVTQFGGYLKF